MPAAEIGVPSSRTVLLIGASLLVVVVTAAFSTRRRQPSAPQLLFEAATLPSSWTTPVPAPVDWTARENEMNGAVYPKPTSPAVYARNYVRGRIISPSPYSHRPLFRAMPTDQSHLMLSSHLNHAIFKDKRGGVFVEAGAQNGVTNSTTAWFELERGWSGLLIEADDALANAAYQSGRNVSVFPGCIANVTDREHNTKHYVNGLGAARVVTTSGDLQQRVVCDKTTHVLLSVGMGKVDLMTINLDGYELEALSGLDLSLVDVSVIVVRFTEGDVPTCANELRCDQNYVNLWTIRKLLLPHGYVEFGFYGPHEPCEKCEVNVDCTHAIYVKKSSGLVDGMGNLEPRQLPPEPSARRPRDFFRAPMPPRPHGWLSSEATQVMHKDISHVLHGVHGFPIGKVEFASLLRRLFADGGNLRRVSELQVYQPMTPFARLLDNVVFRRKLGGLFLEVRDTNESVSALHDTVGFELARDWTGTIVEADAARFADLQRLQRRTYSLNARIGRERTLTDGGRVVRLSDASMALGRKDYDLLVVRAPGRELDVLEGAEWQFCVVNAVLVYVQRGPEAKSTMEALRRFFQQNTYVLTLLTLLTTDATRATPWDCTEAAGDCDAMVFTRGGVGTAMPDNTTDAVAAALRL